MIKMMKISGITHDVESVPIVDQFPYRINWIDACDPPEICMLPVKRMSKLMGSMGSVI